MNQLCDSHLYNLNALQQIHCKCIASLILTIEKSSLSFRHGWSGSKRSAIPGSDGRWHTEESPFFNSREFNARYRQWRGHGLGSVIVLPFSSFHNRVKDAIQLQDEKEIAAYRRKPLCLFFHKKNLGDNRSSSEYKKLVNSDLVVLNSKLKQLICKLHNRFVKDKNRYKSIRFKA